MNGVRRSSIHPRLAFTRARQKDANVTPLKEEDAIPGGARSGLWMGKALHRGTLPLLSARLSSSKRISFASTTSMDRLVPMRAEKEKAPAAMCRKIALQPRRRDRSLGRWRADAVIHVYVDDCVEGMIRMMASYYREPSISEPTNWSPSISWWTWSAKLPARNRQAPQPHRASGRSRTQ